MTFRTFAKIMITGIAFLITIAFGLVVSGSLLAAIGQLPEGGYAIFGLALFSCMVLALFAICLLLFGKIIHNHSGGRQ
jgi:hypothetical protein